MEVMCAVNRGASGALVADFLRFLREIFTTGQRLNFTMGTETPRAVRRSERCHTLFAALEIKQ